MISVVIVSHNGRQHLRHGLEILHAQAETWDEILVADNASHDGTPAMVARDFPHVRLLELGENLGFGAANNRAAALARGEFLLLLNSDAWPAPGALELLRQRLEAAPRLALVAPQLYYPDGRPQFTWVPETGVIGEAAQMLRNRHESAAWNHRLVPALLRPILGPGWYTAACVLVRKSAFDEIGGFDERFFLYFEDVDLCRRLRLAGWRLALESEARAFHVKGGSQSARADLEYRRAQLTYYARHRPAWERRLLERRLRRKFDRLPPSERRRHLLGLLDSPSQNRKE